MIAVASLSLPFAARRCGGSVASCFLQGVGGCRYGFSVNFLRFLRFLKRECVLEAMAFFILFSLRLCVFARTISTASRVAGWGFISREAAKKEGYRMHAPSGGAFARKVTKGNRKSASQVELCHLNRVFGAKSAIRGRARRLCCAPRSGLLRRDPRLCKHIRLGRFDDGHAVVRGLRPAPTIKRIPHFVPIAARGRLRILRRAGFEEVGVFHPVEQRC
jgi:hypothetical protein